MQLQAQAQAQPAAPNLERCFAVRYSTRGLDRIIDPRAFMIEAIVGDRLTFAVDLPGVRRSFRVQRRPAATKPDNIPASGPLHEAWLATQASAPDMPGGALNVNAPGAYIVQAQLDGGWARNVIVAAFPAAALGFLGWPAEGYEQQKRATLRNLIAHHIHGTPTLETVIAALEANGERCGINDDLWGGKLPSIQNFKG